MPHGKSPNVDAVRAGRPLFRGNCIQGTAINTPTKSYPRYSLSPGLQMLVSVVLDEPVPFTAECSYSAAEPRCRQRKTAVVALHLPSRLHPAAWSRGRANHRCG